MTKKSKQNYSGIFGGHVVIENVNGKSVVDIPEKVKPKREPTPGQLQVQERFKLAFGYAKNAMTNPELYALYNAKATKDCFAYKWAVKDYLRPPRITVIDTTDYHGVTGDKIIVLASDCVKVVSVSIRIIGADGNLIEEGLCQLDTVAANYEYTATNQVQSLTGIKIVARVKDTPGNRTEMSCLL